MLDIALARPRVIPSAFEEYSYEFSQLVAKDGYFLKIQPRQFSLRIRETGAM